jgi:DegV family protein with EDD domain
MNIRIVTDSTCDLAEDLIKQYRITVIPNLLMLDGKTYADGIDISRETFYAKLPYLSQLPTTATASTGAYLEAYTSLLAQGADHVLSIHPSLNLSGIYNAANSAATSLEGKVTAIDSRQVSLGLGFQVLAAAKGALEGKSFAEILKRIDSVRSRLRLVAMLDTLEYVQRSGRVSWAKARLAGFLNLRAFIELQDGAIISLGETRTRSKGIDRLVNFVKETGQLENLVILHTNALTEADRLKSLFKDQVTQEAWICNVTTVIGTHVGPNALGFAAVKASSKSTPV